MDTRKRGLLVRVLLVIALLSAAVALRQLLVNQSECPSTVAALPGGSLQVLKATKASLEAEVAQLKSTLSSLDAALHSAAADGTVNDTAAEPGSSNHQSSSKQNEHLEQLFKLVGLQLNENRGKDRKAFAKSLFESQMARWDKDNDGLITKSEFEAVFARQDHNEDGAVSRDEFARWMHKSVRTKPSIHKLQMVVQSNNSSAVDASHVPSWEQLTALGLLTAIPMIGFGFVDNMIMVTAGDAIDGTLGVTLGISQLCSAGLGNILSDVAGVFLSERIEKVALKLGLPKPELTREQLEATSVSVVSSLSGIFGIVLGCLCGMFPLMCKKAAPEVVGPLRVAFDQIMEKGCSKVRTLELGTRLALQVPLTKELQDPFLHGEQAAHAEVDYDEFVGMLNKLVAKRLETFHFKGASSAIKKPSGLVTPRRTQSENPIDQRQKSTQNVRRLSAAE